MDGGSRVIAVVSSDESAVEISEMARNLGYGVESYSSGDAFFKQFNIREDREVCLLLAKTLPDMGALQFVDALKTNQFALPTVLMMETLIASEVVAAMRSGVVNCVELPLTQRALCEVISDAFTLVPNVRKIHEARRYHELYHRLKETEKEIVGMAAIGVPNKQIASRMQLSVKTVEKYRRQAYATLGVNNTAAMTRAITLHSMHNLFDRCRIQFPERSLLATAEIGES